MQDKYINKVLHCLEINLQYFYTIYLYSKAPITVFFSVKDRVLAHNPLGVIYQAESYYKDKLFSEKK